MIKHVIHAFCALGLVSMIGAANVSATAKECPEMDKVQLSFMLNEDKGAEFVKDTFPGWTLDFSSKVTRGHKKDLLTDKSLQLTIPSSGKKTVCNYHLTRNSYVVAKFSLTVKE